MKKTIWDLNDYVAPGIRTVSLLSGRSTLQAISQKWDPSSEGEMGEEDISDDFSK